MTTTSAGSEFRVSREELAAWSGRDGSSFLLVREVYRRQKPLGEFDRGDRPIHYVEAGRLRAQVGEATASLIRSGSNRARRRVEHELARPRSLGPPREPPGGS